MNLYCCYGDECPANSGKHWYVVFNSDKSDIDFIVKFKSDGIFFDDKIFSVMVPYHTYKKNNDIKGLTREIYSYVNKKFDRPILSDKSQSSDMTDYLWGAWFDDPEKYKVKDFKFIDEKQQKELSLDDLLDLQFGFKGVFEHHERYRMMVDFHKKIKPNEPKILKNSKLGFLYGKEGRDWILKK